VQVLDRAGRLVPGAKLAFDTSDVGTGEDIRGAVTDGHGERSVARFDTLERV